MAEKDKKQGELGGMPERDAVGKAALAWIESKDEVITAQKNRNIKEQALLKAMHAGKILSYPCAGEVLSIDVSEPVEKIKSKKQKSHD